MFAQFYENFLQFPKPGPKFTPNRLFIIQSQFREVIISFVSLEARGPLRRRVALRPPPGLRLGPGLGCSSGHGSLERGE